MDSPRELSSYQKNSPHRRRLKHGLQAALALLVFYLVVAYLILPMLWKEHEATSTGAPEATPRVAVNAQGIPGDPLNVGLTGSREELVAAMLSTGWKPADPITLETSLKIAESVLFDRPDPAAPVSNLYVHGRRQDLAFEQETGSSASQRHHVRWWQYGPMEENGRAFWVGSVTYDAGSGVSHLTGEITHHIGPDVDGERDRLMQLLLVHGWIPAFSSQPGRGATRDGRNAGGDPYFTDGLMRVAVLNPPAGKK